MPETPTAVAVVLAGGSGSRFGRPRNKVYLPLAGSTVVGWALRGFDHPRIGRIVLVHRAEDADLARSAAADAGRPVELVTGGAERHDSEWRALSYLAADIETGAVDVVLMHDAARPIVAAALVTTVVDVARSSGAAIPGLALEDVGDLVPPPAPGSRLVRVQTPQAFRAAPLLAAYAAAERDGFRGTDTASCVERYSDLPVQCVPGDPAGLKVTYSGDLAAVEAVLAGRASAGSDSPG